MNLQELRMGRFVLCWLACCSSTWSQSLLDIREVAADSQIPPLVNSEPAAGCRVKQTLPDYGERVYHVVYLPIGWQPSRTYPVIVEYAGNGPYQSPFGDVSTGNVEDSKLGYGITSGRNAIWVCLPFLNAKGTTNVRSWWGDPPHHNVVPTVTYCKQAIPFICKHYGGDPKRVALLGFSRGAIACNYVGLHDEEIAKLWKCMVAYSHYDGVHAWGFPESDRASAVKRLARLGDCPQLICCESTDRLNLQATRDYLQSIPISIGATFLETGFRNHNDAWVLRPSKSRTKLRRWIHEHLEME